MYSKIVLGLLISGMGAICTPATAMQLEDLMFWKSQPKQQSYPYKGALKQQSHSNNKQGMPYEEYKVQRQPSAQDNQKVSGLRYEEEDVPQYEAEDLPIPYLPETLRAVQENEWRNMCEVGRWQLSKEGIAYCYNRHINENGPEIQPRQWPLSKDDILFFDKKGIKIPLDQFSKEQRARVSWVREQQKIFEENEAREAIEREYRVDLYSGQKLSPEAITFFTKQGITIPVRQLKNPFDLAYTVAFIEGNEVKYWPPIPDFKRDHKGNYIIQ